MNMNSVCLEKCTGRHTLIASCMNIDFSHLGSESPAWEIYCKDISEHGI